ncbi:predicted protein [Phaeodactylum tricornutum CCAP 1055/1]|uniref:Uncharacterized protein n=2 Tax=Phaeodactylum tricornutum TaxID=2850 RepID=B7G7D0_PHATC|nr:predicted protein [Phaeodactylum tricornutum CCAP 1055/1]EEC45748.1 predicted protein [Phaeodactylum tricornutum CCAP 1055/1]|eukprot:XP_002183012.1 predicted protein [Phaeodactylum tricornutum CCAP 1055/1]
MKGRNQDAESGKLLQQIVRQFISESVRRPHDAAADAFGKHLAEFYTTSGQIALSSETVWRALCQKNLHCSIPTAFFQYLTERILQVEPDTDPGREAMSFSFLSSWTLHIEEVVREQERGYTALSECLKSYATALVYRSEDFPDSAILDSYRRLRLVSSRSCLIDETVGHVMAEPQRFVIMSSLLAEICLDFQSPMTEKVLFTQRLGRLAWATLDTSSEITACMIVWMMTSLNLLILGVANLSSREEQIAQLNLAQSWILELLAVAQEVWCQTEKPSVHVRLRKWLYDLVSNVLLRLANQVPQYAPHFSPIVGALHPLLEEAGLVADMVMTFRLCVLTLLTSGTESQALIRMLASLRYEDQYSRSILQVLTSSHFDEDGRQSLAQHLHHSYGSLAGISHEEDPKFHLLRLLNDPSGAFFSNIVLRCDFSAKSLSPAQQLAVLLFGAAMLADEDRCGMALTYLTELVASYPHLGIQLVPVIVSHINESCLKRDFKQATRNLEFLCSALVSDPHCAHHVWNLVGIELMKKDSALSLRIAAVRLFPRLCRSNNRLYRRIIDTFGACLVNEPIELRLAVSASICDLAKDDLLRDVSDVIGWIQQFLTEDMTSPIRCLQVHYALLSLHYLVISDELDFDVVIKVINKRLCSVHDYEAVLQLPLIVLEALVLLLGDGSSSSPSDKGSIDGNESATAAEVSLQVSLAIDLLLHIGKSLEDGQAQRRPFDVNRSSTENQQRCRIRLGVLKGLSAYPLYFLGLDDSGMKSFLESKEDPKGRSSILQSGFRYKLLVDIVIGGVADTSLEKQCQGPNPAVCLARKIVNFEDNTLGSALWLKEGRRSSKVTKRHSKTLFAILPTSESMDTLLSGNTSGAAVAISRLICADGSQLSILRDNADACIEGSDPLFLSLALQGYLHVAATLVSFRRPEIGDILEEIGSWYEAFVSPDAMYLSLAALSVYILADMHEQSSKSIPYAEEIYDLVLKAFKEKRFHKDSISKLAVSLIGVNCIRRGSSESLDQVILVLEHSIRGYGGQQDFGAYYGLALISQALSTFTTPIQLDGVRSRICRTVGFLMEDLLACFDDAHAFFRDIVACIKSGSYTTDLLDTILDVDRNSISVLMTKHVVARYLFFSLAHCLPALKLIDGKIFIVVLHAIETLERGGGKGIVLPAIAQSCQATDLLELDKLKPLSTQKTAAFDSRMSSDAADIASDGLGDIFYAVNGKSNRPTLHVVRQLLAGNIELFDDNACVLSLIAVVSKVCLLPFLGTSPFVLSPKLRENVSQSDLESIVDLVSQAAQSESDSKSSRMALVMMSILSCLMNADELSAATALSQKSEETQAQMPPTRSSKQGLAINFSKLPCPKSGTALDGIMDVLENASIDPMNSVNSFCASVAVLQSLSLPEQFAKSFIEPLLQEESCAIKTSLIDLLLSQIQGRRKVTFDGRDFVTLALRLCLAPEKEKKNQFGGVPSFQRFVEALPLFAMKLPSSSFEKAINEIWQRCVSVDEMMPSILGSFFTGMKGMLCSTALSPKALNCMRRFVLTKMLAQLGEMDIESVLEVSALSNARVIDGYSSCLIKIPLLTFDNIGFFDYDTADRALSSFQVLRSIAILELVRNNFFEDDRQRLELAKMSVWIAALLPYSRDAVAKAGLRRIMCSFASASSKAKAVARPDPLAALFENLLQMTPDSIVLGLDWLAVSMSSWSGGKASDGEMTLGFLSSTDVHSYNALPPADLDRLFAVFLDDLPFNLGLFCRQHKTFVIKMGKCWHRL